MELFDEVSSVREVMEEVEQFLLFVLEEIYGLKLRNLQLEFTVREKEGEVSDFQEQCQFLEIEVESLRLEVNNFNEEFSQVQIMEIIKIIFRLWNFDKFIFYLN